MTKLIDKMMGRTSNKQCLSCKSYKNDIEYIRKHGFKKGKKIRRSTCNKCALKKMIHRNREYYNKMDINDYSKEEFISYLNE